MLPLLSRRHGFLWFEVMLLTVFIGLAVPTIAQRGAPLLFEGTTNLQQTQQSAPVVETLPWGPELPQLTEAQRAQLERGQNFSHLRAPPKDASGVLSAPPIPGTEAVLTSKEILGDIPPHEIALDTIKPEGKSPHLMFAPSDFLIYRAKAFGGVIPTGYKSNVMEMSIINTGKFLFATGNWFAARSTDGGQTWSFVSPFAGFSDFCCDQVSVYDKSRDLLIWLRQGISASNGANRFKLSVSTNRGSTWCTYTTRPSDLNSSWTNQWFDFPRIAVGVDYLYITFNIFDSSGWWKRSVIMRWPLNKLRACKPFTHSWYASPNWFTFVPIQGSNHHVMYFASNFPPSSPWNRIRIWKWEEDSGSLSWVTRTVPGWSWTGFSCGKTANWLGRVDDRLLTGARYVINSDRSSTERRIRGRSILVWMWNAGTDTNFPKPHIEAAAFFEDTLQLVPGRLGRPYVWRATRCFAYPAVASNSRGDLGLVFHMSTGTKEVPSIGAAIADDFVNAPPPWRYYVIKTSTALPSDNKWGDYNSVQPFAPSELGWIAGLHFISSKTNCQTCGVPYYFAFGRRRDFRSWARWRWR